MGCFGGCFRVLRKSCGEFRARLSRRLISGKVGPQGTGDVAASEELQTQISQPTVTLPYTKPEESPDREESRTPEAFKQMDEEFVEYEMKKIKALSQLENDVVAEEMMAPGATIHEINEAIHKQMKDGMARVDI